MFACVQSAHPRILCQRKHGSRAWDCCYLKFVRSFNSMVNQRESYEGLWHLPRRHMHQMICWKRVSDTAERFGLQAIRSICRDVFPAFISERIRWRVSAKNRSRDESRCLKVSPPLRSKVGVSNIVELCPMRAVWESLSQYEISSMRITLTTGNELCEVFKALCKRNKENRIVVFQQGSFTVYCFDR